MDNNMGSHLRTQLPPGPPQPRINNHPQPMFMMMAPSSQPPPPPQNMYPHPLFATNSTPTIINPNPNSNTNPLGSILQKSYYNFSQLPPMPVPSLNHQFAGSGPTSQQQNETHVFEVEPVKKRRGRPRKYPLDNNNNNNNLLSDSGASTPSLSPAIPMNHMADSSSSNPPAKKSRGRPLGSGKKQLNKSGSTTGVAFAPHVLYLEEGEDIVAKLYEFSKEGPRTVSVFSVTGSVCDVTIVHPPQSGSTVTHKGPLQILSLTATFLPSENNDSPNQAVFTISLSGSDGGVVGGEVQGKLIAATKIQIILISFIIEAKKPISTIQSNEGDVPAVDGESPPSDCPSSAASQEHVDNSRNDNNNSLSRFENLDNTNVYNMGQYGNVNWS